MALDPKLQEIASGAAGVYMLETDSSQSPTFVADSRMRLLVTNIPKGRVNSIAYFGAGDFRGFQREFGDIDPRAERNGNFSVRSCMISLENGPIAVLNLREFDDAQDQAGANEIGATPEAGSIANRLIPYSGMFDINRFWKVDARNLLVDGSEKLLNFGNIGDKKVSVFVRKSRATGYDVKVAEYYAAQNRPVPMNIDGEALISDFLVDTFFFANDMSDKNRVLANENYGFLFEDLGADFGVKSDVFIRDQFQDGLEALSSISDSGFITKVTTSLVPGMTTMSNVPMFIETVLNGSLAYQTGIIVKVNEDLLDAEGDFIPGASNISDGQKRPVAIDLIGHGFFHIDAGGELASPISFNDFFTYDSSGYAKQTLGFNFASGEASAAYDNTKGLYALDAIIESPSKFIVPSMFSIRAGDRVVGATGNLVRVKSATSIGEKIYLVGLHTTHPLQATGALFPKDASGIYVYPVGHADAGEPLSYNTGVPTNDPQYGYPMDAVTGGAVIAMPTLTNEQVATLKTQIGTTFYMIRVETSDAVITGDATTATALAGSLTFEDSTTFNLATVGLQNKQVFFFVTPDRFSSIVKGFTLDFYKPRRAQFLDGTSATQRKVLNVLGQVGIRNSILSNDFRIRYFIDCFKSFVESDIKGQLAAIAKDKRVLAIANAPFMKDLAKSRNPYFKSTPNSQLDLKYVATGGNRDLVSSNTLTLPKYGDSNIAFFGPGFIADYYGQEVIVTPAAAVSKAFVAKFIAGQPFDIVANTSGIVSAQGLKDLEYQISDVERKYLEPFGYNSIIKKSNGAFAIYGNQTAQNTTRTSLSKIHVRELVILIQERMYIILEDNIFKFNNAQTRLQVKTRADSEMQLIQDNGGVVWYQNICDDSNNTAEVIEADMGILETFIVASRGGEKWVHRTNIQSGVVAGFEVSQL